MTWVEAEVVAHAPEGADDIVKIELAPAAGAVFSPYSAGAHVDVMVTDGVVRQYSLCGPPGNGRYRLAVLYEPESRGGSRAMHALKVGDRLRISEPRNRFPLVEARRHRLFAGGIGITPLLAMVQELDATGGDYVLHYCARSRGRAAFVSELVGNGRVTFNFDDEDPGQRLDIARDLGDPQPETAVYVCGPSGFIEYVMGKAEALGWPPDALHTERFRNDQPVVDTAADGSGGFKVRLRSTGEEYFVPAGRTVLDVLLEKGVLAPYSCQQGICGECAVRVLAGEPDHRDDVLTDDERTECMFTTCLSRAVSPVLEIDL